MNLGIAGLAAGLCALFAVPASAHHSFAMFDNGKTATLTGTVKEFDLVNPHGWLQVMAPDAQGRPVEWDLEMGGPAQLSRMGLDAQSIKPGDKVTVRMHPLRDGSNGGQFMSVLLPSGKTLGMGGFR